MTTRQGITSKPILIMIAAVVLAGFVTYLNFTTPKGKVDGDVAVTANANTYVNANTAANANTVVAVNTNASTNTNTTVDATQGWKAYNNTTYNFSFKYPSELKITAPCGTTGSLVTYCGDIGGTITFFVHPSTDIVAAGWFSASTVDSDTTSTIQGKSWRIVKVTRDSDKRTSATAITVVGNRSYSFFVTYQGSDDVKLSLLNNITSTFSTSDATADWKTYTNLTYGFSFKYPKEWSVIENNIQKTKREAHPADNLLIGMKSGNGNQPSMQLYVDPEGWGTGSAYKVMSIKHTAQGLIIASEETTDLTKIGEFNIGQNYSVRMAESDTTSSAPDFFATFGSTTIGSTDPSFDDLVKNIIQSFTFTK